MLIKWIDLSAHGAQLSALLMPDGHKRLVITGVPEGSELWTGCLERLDFKPSRSGNTLLRMNTKLTLGEFKAVFPNARLTDIPREQIVKVAPMESAPGDNRPAEDLRLRTAAILGHNHLGHEVYETEAGRFTRDVTVGEITANEEDGAEKPYLFLRGFDRSPADRIFCAEGFVHQMAVLGKTMKPSDVQRFGAVVYGSPDMMLEADDPRLKAVQEAIEAAINRKFAATYRENPEPNLGALYTQAVALVDRQPRFIFRDSDTVSLAQYSTLAPLALVAQMFVGNTAGKTVLEPCVGNAALVSLLPDQTTIVGVDIDQKRVDQAAVVRPDLAVKQGDATLLLFEELNNGQQYDHVISNPPFGELQDKQEFQGLPVRRLDHLIALRSLEARREDGLGVFILSGDHPINASPETRGKLTGSSAYFFAWLADHYHIETAVELDGRLFAKQDAQYPSRLVVVGRRRTAAEAEEARASKQFRLESLPVVGNWEELWTHARLATEQMLAMGQAQPMAPDAENAMAVVGGEAGAEHSTALTVTGAAAQADHGPVELTEYQTPYVAMSKAGEVTSMVPRNLLIPIQEAQQKLIEIIGTDDVDSWVVRKLNLPGFDLEYARQVLTPEQFDAVAFSIYNVERGKGFILGDQTGRGKGRALATAALYALSTGHHVSFVTANSGLFTDFWRDISDVCGDRVNPKSMIKPFILNYGVDIRDQANKVVFRPTPPEIRKTVLGSEEGNNTLRAHGFNMLFASYSQFNLPENKSEKAAWLSSCVKDGLAILDESHLAAGESNTAENIASALDQSWGTVYSSATFAKDAKNMAAYKKVFPAGICDSNLADILIAGGEPLQEIMCAMLAKDGVFLRREQDSSNLTFITHEDTANISRNEEFSNALSDILLAMAHLSGDVRSIATIRNRENRQTVEDLPNHLRQASKLKLTSMNFGSRHHVIKRQFMAALKVEAAAEIAIRELRAGKKPVIMLEQTMGSLVQSLISEPITTPAATNNLALPAPGQDQDEAEVNERAADFRSSLGQAIPQPMFRDLLYRLVDRLCSVSKKDGYGKASRNHILQISRNPQEQAKIQRAIADIRAAIAEFPDLPASPIDSLRQRIEHAGFSCGEVSGRQFQLNRVTSDIVQVAPKVSDNTKIRFDFNNGDIDALVVTRAGSSGSSIHNSPKFRDLRPRVGVVLEPSQNINDFFQILGRISRLDQLSAPTYYVLSTGLPAEVYLLTLHNRKLRSLSASVQSNMTSANEVLDIPDILNRVGDEICYRYIEERPHLEETLDCHLSSHPIFSSAAPLARKLIGRLSLLNTDMQREILGELGGEYNAKIQELNAAGLNPLRSHFMDLRAKHASEYLYAGVDQDVYHSVFDMPVYLRRIEWQEEVQPIRYASVVEAINRSVIKLQTDGRIRLPLPGESPDPVDFCDIIAVAKRKLGQLKNDVFQTMTDKFETIEMAIEAEDPNSIQSIHAREEWLEQALSKIKPGKYLRYVTGEGEVRVGVVTKMTVPRDEQLHLLGQYHLSVSVPGASSPDDMTLNMLINADYDILPTLDDSIRSARDVFDQAPSGLVTMGRWVFDGNIFKAAQVSAQKHMGRSAIYTDEHGAPRRAIVLSSMMTLDKIMDTDITIDSAEIAYELLIKFRDSPVPMILSTAPDESDKPGAMIARDTSGAGLTFKITTPGKKATGGHWFTNPDLIGIVGNFSGNRQYMKASFPVEMLPDVLAHLYNNGDVLYAPPDMRREVNEIAATVRNRIEERLAIAHGNINTPAVALPAPN